MLCTADGTFPIFGSKTWQYYIRTIKRHIAVGGKTMGTHRESLLLVEVTYYRNSILGGSEHPSLDTPSGDHSSQQGCNEEINKIQRRNPRCLCCAVWR